MFVGVYWFLNLFSVLVFEMIFRWSNILSFEGIIVFEII
jgi:hypothetical protein